MDDARNAVVAKLAAATLMAHAKILPDETALIKDTEDAYYALLGSLTVVFVAMCNNLQLNAGQMFNALMEHCTDGGFAVPEEAWSEELEVAFATIQASFAPTKH